MNTGFNAIGTMIVSRILYVEYLNYLKTNLGVPLQLYRGNELIYFSNEIEQFGLDKETIITKDIINKFSEDKNKPYLIKEQVFNNNKYIVGYIPIRDFFGQAIGYFTIVSSLVDSQTAINSMIKKISVNGSIILLLSFLIINYKEYYYSFEKNN